MLQYKKSFYNIEILYKNSVYVYNPFKGIVKLNQYLFESLNNLNSAKDGHIQVLLKNGLIVDKNLDEFKKVNFINYIAKLNMNQLSLSISPTFACNFICSYCFVKKSNVIMDKQVQNDILFFVENRLKAGTKSLKVTWFGGEPLLAFDILEYLSQNFINLCNKYNCRYDAFLITNGTLLNSEYAKILKKLNIKGIQITLDGPERIHNQKRPFENGNSFYVILSNLKKIEDIKFNVRINLCKDNYKYIDELLEIISQDSIRKKINDICLSPVFKTEYMKEEERKKCFEIEEYAEVELEILKKILSKKLPKKIDIKRVNVGNSKEVLWDMNIDPLGNVYKDEFYMGNKNDIAGNIREINLKTIVNNPHFIKHIMSNKETEHKCKECKILPVCMNGNLQHMSCISLKYNIKEQLKLYIDNGVCEYE
ncbi:MAG: radical SAM protein [Tissierellaceae bacterium]|jgi:uncharacterized protein|nr:radical SAM protein [Tissierellaceae bacterium]